jgi:hypothetical protein
MDDEEKIEEWVIDRLNLDFNWLEKQYNKFFELHLRTDNETREFFYFVLN